MSDLRFFYSPGSRYSYLALTQMPKIEREFGVEFAWTPTVGGRIRELRGADPFRGPPQSGQYDWEYRRRDAEAWARYYGVDFQEPRSHELDAAMLGVAAVAASRSDRHREYSCALAAEVFARSSWPIDEALCLGVAAQVGIDGDAFERAFRAPEVAQELEENCRSAFERGVFGNPSCIVGDELFWGQDRLPLVRHALELRR